MKNQAKEWHPLIKLVAGLLTILAAITLTIIIFYL